MAKRTFRQEPTGGNCSRAADCHYNPRGYCRRVERAWLRASTSFARFDSRVLRRPHFRCCDHCVVFWAARRQGLRWRSGACSVFFARAARNLSARAGLNVRIRANVPEGAARTGPTAKDGWTKSTGISGRCEESHAGDLLLLPIAIIAFWTLAYDLVLVARWPAQTVTWCFMAFAIAGAVGLCRLWTKTNAVPGKNYQFHPSHLLPLALGLAYAITALFVRRPNQDDVV